MNGKDLINALDDLDDDLIMQADKKPVKRNIWVKAAALAACISLAVLAVFALVRKPEPQPQLSATPENQLMQVAPTEAATQPAQVTSTETANASVSYLTVDINPSIRFTVEDGKVTGCVALNDDAQPILSELDLTGKSLAEAIPLVIAALVEQGYLAQAEQAPVLLLATYGGAQPVELLEAATQAAKESLESQQINTYIVSQQVINVETVKKLAQQYGVSEGKMQYVLNLLSEENDISLEDAASSTIVELFGMDIARRVIEPRYQVGEYDEYGEKVLYAGWPETMQGYIPWEELAQDYKESLKLIYSPEDLAILSQPREWTTVPNAVGLPEAEARALMNSRKIAVRVAYIDDPEVLQGQAVASGVCFKQDAAPGMRWNSDASLTIFIYIEKENP